MHEPHDVRCAAATGRSEKGTNENTLVNRDCFAQMVPLAEEDVLRETTRYFAA